MDISLNQVFNLLKSSPEGLTSKEILKNLDVSKAKKNKLKTILKRLKTKNKIFKKNNKYLAFADLIQKPNSAKSEKGKQKGIFYKRGEENIIRSMDSDKEFIMSKKAAVYLMDGDQVYFSPAKGKTKNNFAEVIKVSKRNHIILNGTIELSKKKVLYFKPIDKKISQSFSIKNPSKDLEVGQAVKLKIVTYPSPGVLPTGKLVSADTSPVDEDQFVEELFLLHKVRTEFPKEVLEEVSKFSTSVRFSNKDGRKDLRELPFVTIDGITAKDFDDAIYLTQEAENYRLYVSIADVADYVTDNSALDEEAKERGTSIYLPDFVVPMLPEELSNHLCSLKEGYNRKTLTAEILMDQKGNTLSVDIYPSMIKTIARLTYEEVDEYLNSKPQIKSFKKARDNNSLDPKAEAEELQLSKKLQREGVKERIDLYIKVSKILSQKRKDRGCFDFTLPDTYFKWKKDTLVDIQKSYQTKAQKMIEQFMLEANEAVAKFCSDKKIPILYRNHDDPDQQKIQSFLQVHQSNGIEAPKKSKNQALEIFYQLENHPNRDWLESMLIRSMSQANYGDENQGHYGLAATYYCHFTSPIRRYPDLVVHRALKHYWRTNKKLPLDKNIGLLTSQRERTAVTIERDATKIKKMNFMSNFIGQQFEAKISGIMAIGLYAEIHSPYVEGFIPLKMLTDDYYFLNEEKQLIIGKRTKKKVNLGSKLLVTVLELDPKRKTINLEWNAWVD